MTLFSLIQLAAPHDVFEFFLGSSLDFVICSNKLGIAAGLFAMLSFNSLVEVGIGSWNSNDVIGARHRDQKIGNVENGV
jgi:hypothetical protein